MELREYQKRAIDRLYQWFEAGAGHPLVVAPTGCHAAGTNILMADGTVKRVEDVRVGDAVMGPDSWPRHVLRLCRGREPMYRITPNSGGDPFIVNASHILSLQTTNEGKGHGTTGREIDNVSVSDWLNKRPWWRHLRKLRRVGVELPRRQRPDLCPWVLGALIGDGSIIRGVKLSNPDVEVLDAVLAEMERHGLEYTAREKVGGVRNWDVSFTRRVGTAQANPVADILRELRLFGGTAAEKFVPDCYKLSDRDTRLQVLAGLLDTDGHLSTGYFDFISKSRQLADDVAFLARSVDLAASVRGCSKSCQTGNGGTYWRVSIYGDIDGIPTRVARKQAPERRQKKNPLVTGFDVEPIGEGDFYGFTLDGDHLYLTADFTVHHNSGKSVMIGAFTRRACSEYPATRVLVATHVKELIEQNFARLKAVWPEANAGIYAAGIGRRDVGNQVTVASIQSIYKRALQLGRYDLILVDEAHLIPPKSEGMYRTFLDAAERINPHVKVIGWTATPYRLRQGMLFEGDGALFDGVAAEITIGELLEAGHLCRLTTEPVRTRTSTDQVGTRQGEYITSQLAAAVDVSDVTAAAAREIVELGRDRSTWLVFAVTVKHAEHVRDALEAHGVRAAVVTGKTPKRERERTLVAYKQGHIRALVNVDVLTTGFDHPGIDLVAFLRPTLSPGLYLQMAGRGMRTAPGKADCLVLDFAGNIDRHGPVDSVRPPKAPDPSKGGGGAVEKACPECYATIHASAPLCPRCGHQFPAQPAHEATASDAEILSNSKPPEAETLEVSEVRYSRHQKPGKAASLRVDYYAGLHRVASEWVCLEHGGYAQARARLWWVERRRPDVSSRAPDSVNEALERTHELAEPVSIQVQKRARYNDVVGVTLPDREAA